MLPVQTVMIRYMVLVYRWGNGWLGAVGDWGGLWAVLWRADARDGGPPPGATATRTGREKAPPT